MPSLSCSSQCKIKTYQGFHYDLWVLTLILCAFFGVGSSCNASIFFWRSKQHASYSMFWLTCSCIQLSFVALVDRALSITAWPFACRWHGNVKIKKKVHQESRSFEAIKEMEQISPSDGLELIQPDMPIAQRMHIDEGFGELLFSKLTILIFCPTMNADVQGLRARLELKD